MLENIILEDGQLDHEILEELYTEGLELSRLVVEYFQTNKKESLQHLGVDRMGFYTIECNRMTTGIMQVVSWCLMQKGLSSGEISSEQAGERKSRLSDTKLFFKPIGCAIDDFPAEFIDYSNRIRNLFERIVRIDRVLYENENSIKNPVHDLMDQIKNTSDK